MAIDVKEIADLKATLKRLEGTKVPPEQEEEKSQLIAQYKADIEAAKQAVKASVLERVKQPEKPAQFQPMPFGAMGAQSANYMLSQQAQSEAERARNEKLAEFAITNPEAHSAAMLAGNGNGLEAFSRAYQEGLATVGRGVGMDIPQNSPQKKAYDEAMSIQHPVASAVGEALPPALLALPASVAASMAGGPTAAGALLARGPLQASVTGLESNIIARGKGDDAAAQTAMGAGIGYASEVLPFGLGRFARWVGDKFGINPARIANPETGEITQGFKDFLKRNDITEEQLIAEANNPILANEAVNKSIPRDAAAKTAEYYNPQPDVVEDIVNVLQPSSTEVGTFQRYGHDVGSLPMAAIAEPQAIAQAWAARAQVDALEGSKVVSLATNLNKGFAEEVQRAGGMIESNVWGAGELERMRGKIREIKANESGLYDLILDDVARFAETTGGRINPNPTNLKELSAKRKIGLREDEQGAVSPIIEKIDEMVKSRASYAKWDIFRRKMGQAAFKREGEFKDEETGLATAAYEAVSEDLLKFAERNMGNIETINQARQMTVNRKKLESAIDYFGGDARDGTGSMHTKFDTATLGLQRGDVNRFNQTFDNLPEESKRTALVTLLASRLKLPVGGEVGSLEPIKVRSSANNFVTTWKGAKAVIPNLKETLTEPTFNMLDDYAVMYNALARANSAPPTGAALGKAGLSYGEEPKWLPNMFARLVGVATGGLGREAADAAASAALKNIPVSQSIAIGNLTKSRTFLEAVTTAAQNPESAKAKSAGIRLMQTKAAQDYLNKISPDHAAQIIAAGGLPVYLTQQDKE